MIKKIFIGLALVCCGCGSTPNPETQFFVLTPNAQTKSNSELVNRDKDENMVLLKPIKVAEFLDQPGIVLQTDTHQIEVAHYHRWAEPLKRNLHRYIKNVLTTQLPQHGVLSGDEINKVLSYRQLEITVNQFNGTTDGLAVLSGYWTLKIAGSKTQPAKKTFSYQSRLTNNGYPELVKELAELMNQLSKDIADSIKQQIVVK